MKINNHISRITLAGVILICVNAHNLRAQTPPVDPANHAAHVASGNMQPMTNPGATKSDLSLSQQLSQSQAKVAQLQAALAKTAMPSVATPTNTPLPGMTAPAPAPSSMPMEMGMDKMPESPMPSIPPPAPPMAGMDAKPAPPMKMMSMMDKMMGMMDKMMPMPDTKMAKDTMPAPAAPMSMDMMGMMGMSPMVPMPDAAPTAMPPSALPGFPGASHLYHIGATGFFLDHSQHITLSGDQQSALNKIKEQAILAKNTSDRSVEQAEQALWMLTAADQPDAAKINAKISEIETLRANERLAFIRSVGDASKFLTDDQRKSLTGFAPPAPASASMPMPPAETAASVTPAMAPMPDM